MSRRFFMYPAPDGAAVGEAPLSMLIPTWSLVAANIWFGIDTRLSVGVSREATSTIPALSPTTAPAPMRTGATSLDPLPIKAPSSMTVGCLSLPS